MNHKITMDSINLSDLEPSERLRHLINYSNAIEIDPNVNPTRYYRSGLEMVRMANVYYKEGSLENAYVLYLKFMTLFLEKIRKHPGFGSVPSKIKADNHRTLKEIFPKAERIKVELLQQYKQDYQRYAVELKQRERHQPSVERSSIQSPSVSSNSIPCPYLNLEEPANLDAINYPDPSAPSAPPQYEKSGSTASYDSLKPSIDRSTKPLDVICNCSSYTKEGLRTVIVPSSVITLFLIKAQKNTIQNVETCGVLAGKLEHNELIITHMIIPKQVGTADSCVAMNEEELFDYQDQHNLITIGWIHTHPTQSAFLSSVDLHTHCPYQLLMPEAIAIVCAPRYNETGIFVLTPDHGLSYIASCRQTGFHPHPTDPPLYMNVEHVRVVDDAILDVMDLRTG